MPRERLSEVDRDQWSMTVLGLPGIVDDGEEFNLSNAEVLEAVVHEKKAFYLKYSSTEEMETAKKEIKNLIGDNEAGEEALIYVAPTRHSILIGPKWPKWIDD